MVQRFHRADGMLEQTWIVRDTKSIRDAQLHDTLVNNASNPRLNLGEVRLYPANGLIRDRDIFPAGSPHLLELQKRLRAAGLGESLSVDIHRDDQQSVAFILHRHSGDARPYTREDEEFLLNLRPHVGKAAELSWVIDRQAEEIRQIETIADALQVGIVLCDDAGQVRWANESAEEVLSRSSCLSGEGGRLRGGSLAQEKELQALLQTQQGGLAETLVFGAGDEGELHLARIRLTNSRGMSALLISEPRRSLTPSIKDIAALLQLTQAEARVTAALCTGSTLKEYAQSRGISEGSARNQLKQVLSKTGARRQTELVLRLCSSVLFQTRTQPGSRLLS
ncbi:helix-turn-helix transcriptional regulator [Aurantiacibacter xanthus]|uniref:helix-turn-helix transcriptional regulator n=1 Tax=Aurantiacibacter xanthus TaxID=1784712 RepID=UPI001C723FB0|nr:helix-turn-helix transcriptional regulator [Aurantiacibacter xanthus]